MASRSHTHTICEADRQQQMTKWNESRELSVGDLERKRQGTEANNIERKRDMMAMHTDEKNQKQPSQHRHRDGRAHTQTHTLNALENIGILLLIGCSDLPK